MRTTNDTRAELRRRPTFDFWAIVLLVFGTGNLANGLWMLWDPAHWYRTLPAAVPDFGPLNEHFVRDIGCAFTLLGVALVASAFVPRWRVGACVASTAFAGLHAMVHVIDTTRGLVGSEHWWIDFPGVYLPTVLLALLTWAVWRAEGGVRAGT
jgi:hypothetical protein